MSAPYVPEVYRWRYLSQPSPELMTAEADEWLGVPGAAVDLGCGLGTEARYLAVTGWSVLVEDISPESLRRARSGEQEPLFVRADVLELPVPHDP